MYYLWNYIDRVNRTTEGNSYSVATLWSGANRKYLLAWDQT